MQCGKCGASIVRGADECPSCGEPAFRKDRPTAKESWQEDEKRRENDLLRQVDYEAHRYGLMPKLESETIDEYRTRVDAQKTPRVISEMEGLTGRWARLASRMKP
jgi:hypothetical protein